MQIKVLLIHNTLWSHYKAAVFSELYLLLKERNIDLIVIQQAVTEGMRKNLGDIDLSLHKYPSVLLSDKSLDSISSITRIVKLVCQVIKSNSNVVIIPGYSDIAYWFALLAAKVMGKRCIISFDSTEADKPRKFFSEILKKIFIAQFKMGFCYGTSSGRYLNKLGMTEEKIYIRCQATDNTEIEAIHTHALSSREQIIRQHGFRQRNFVYVGRLSREKNIDTLLAAYVSLKRRFPSAQEWGLLIIGAGPEEERLTKTISEKNIQDVHLLGGMSWKQVPEFFALADVLVLPSYSEPWGLVVNEAMACGMPVIVSERCGAAGDIVLEGDNGFTFDPNNEAGLIDKMSYYVLHPERIAVMGQRSREIIACYSPHNAALEMTGGILDLVHSHVNSPNNCNR
jgi:glycosyltransferase involved in cell wall biosynthesis